MQDSAPGALQRAFTRICEAIEIACDELTDLDGAIGDADHGITMSIGFEAVTAELSRIDVASATAAEMLARASDAFLDAVGASTGPLYATAFRRASKALAGIEAIDAPAAARLLQAMADGISERGRAQRGDKTMLDAWIPAAEAAARAAAAGAAPAELWQAATAAAEAGANATRSMVAAKGRAAWLGERSLGHVDPGAASAVIIIRAMAEVFGRA